jgi:energy-coupling factor transport system substrate-specific component
MTTATAMATRTPRRPAAVGLHLRSTFALAVASGFGVLAFGWPFLLHSKAQNVNTAHTADAPWIFAIVLPLLLVVVLAEVADGGMDAKAIALLGVLTACGAALRPLGIDATGASPVFFLLIPAGRVLGRGFGFVLGTLTLFASALLTGGVGPWLPFQMLAAGWVGLFAGCLPPLRGKLEIAMLAAYGAAAGLLYGAITNLWFWPFETSGLSPQISYVPGASWVTEVHHYAAFYVATSVGWDLTRALGNAVLVVVAGRAVLLALRRAARRAAFTAPIAFVPPTPALLSNHTADDRSG